ncbi:MAG TPA: pyrroloquinoline quinone-dependent dehydrogenase [Bryobacteraceae bacterium]|jgi:quinoprotein glucose dehydrogenase|nr:pyrroloquinoline quinone-dependent dehydrogenase [Bryobacteraceae bacterium]
MIRNLAVRQIFLAGATLFGAATFLHAQAGAKNGEWRTYGADLGNTKYSALDQINVSNFNNLKLAWRFHTENLGPKPEFNMEDTPLMVKGVVYTTAGTRRDVVALDAGTGELLWVHGENEGPRGAAAPRQLSGRGLAWWSDGKEDRIIYVTPGYRLVALDAKTGAPVASFGKGGIVDLKLDDDQQIDLVTGEVGLHATPLVAGNTVIVGAAHLAGGEPKSKSNVKGYVRGFDVRSGKRLWIFHTIPKPGEFGYNTWEKDSAEYTGNTGVWAQISVDEELGIAYLPVELPTGDYYGGHRPGNGLFGESIVAVDLKTGQRKWHYQLVHHGIWDMDIPCAPMLVDITVNGRPVKALAQPTKQQILYVFNRVTGDPIWPIEEKPVPKGDVPGEWYSPTQPMPSKPPVYGRNGFSADEVIDFTPALKEEGLKIMSRYRIGPLFTPPTVSKPGGPLGTLDLGCCQGGTNWPGGSFDPQTHMLYVYGKTELTNLGLVPPEKSKSDMNYVRGQVAFDLAQPDTPSALTVQGLPLFKPPYGAITAINLDKGEIVWQIAHGETPDNVRNHPLLKGLNIPRTGRAGNIGIVTTSTLVISGEAGFITNAQGQRGAYLRAYDKATGKDAGAVFMPAGETGAPMTYMHNGKQYILLAIGGQGFPAELVAYALPN